MRILFFGHGKWACITLREFVKVGYELVGVVAETDEYEEREKEANEKLATFGAYESLKECATEMGIPLFQPVDINDAGFVKQIKALHAELLVCVSYHSIFKKDILNMFSGRVLNLHLGPLPRYRGRAPINWAIINGEQSTGVTVHLMNQQIDTGPIIVQESVPILDDDRAIDVLLRSLPYFPKLALEAIGLIERNETKATYQDQFEGTYFPRRRPEDGLIDWSIETTEDIHNKIRALTDPYPGAFSFFKNKKLVFLESRLPKDLARVSPLPGVVFGKTREGGVKVTTIDGYIIINRVRVEGSEHKATDYFRLGSRLYHPPFPEAEFDSCSPK